MLNSKLKKIKRRADSYDLTIRTPSTPGVRSKGQNIFSEGGHAAYQMKGNDVYNNMHAILLHLYTHSTHGM